MEVRVRGSVPGLGGFKETKMFLPHPRVKVSIVGSLRDREVACSASDRQGSNFESCVWRTVSSQSSHHTQEVLLAQFSLYVHKGGLKPDSFHLWRSLLPNISSHANIHTKISVYIFLKHSYSRRLRSINKCLLFDFLMLVAYVVLLACQDGRERQQHIAVNQQLSHHLQGKLNISENILLG